MPKDGLRRLPDQVTAQLLHALMTLPTPRHARLSLRRADDGRPPGYDAANDYDVMFQGRRVGRIWRHKYTNHPYEAWLWHWYWRNVEGRADCPTGHAPTLESAMADFRKAWDSEHASRTA